MALHPNSGAGCRLSTGTGWAGGVFIPPVPCLSEPAAPAPHPQAGKPARETPSTPIAYAIVSDSIVAVGLSNCTADAVPDGWLGGYSPGCDCAATAFAVGATDQVDVGSSRTTTHLAKREADRCGHRCAPNIFRHKAIRHLTTPCDGAQGPPRQCSMRLWSGVNPWFTPHRTAWVRLLTSILR